MADPLIDRLRRQRDVSSLLDCVLDLALARCGAERGSVQFMDWETGRLAIKAQRGFEPEFMRNFERMDFEAVTVCAKAVRAREQVVVSDVAAAHEFGPRRDTLVGAGVRAVLSTPMISTTGAFLGVLSMYFSRVHSPAELERHAVKAVARMGADAAVRILGKSNRANAPAGTALKLLKDTGQMLAHMEWLLSGLQEAD
jgi:GAF domain-containing protein